MTKLCACHSGQAYACCCQPYLTGQASAPDAESLMRSRYVAYVLHNRAYLLNSWHPSTRPADLQLEPVGALQWLGLEVISSSSHSVEFIAHYRSQGIEARLHERSRFLYENGQWFYQDGVQLDPSPSFRPQKTARNAPCPCGSGKKYKRCCAR